MEVRFNTFHHCHVLIRNFPFQFLIISKEYFFVRVELAGVKNQNICNLTVVFSKKWKTADFVCGVYFQNKNDEGVYLQKGSCIM